MSVTFVLSGLLVGAVIAILYSIAKPRPFVTFMTVEGFFALLALLSWASVGIFFEGENIVRRSFFVFDTRYPISHIRRVRFDSNEDSFGATNPFVTIEFKNGKRFLLFSFVTVDLYRIIDRIRSSASEAVDTGLIKNINDAADKERNWRKALRPGDGFLFTAGAIFLFLIIIIWLFQRLHIIL